MWPDVVETLQVGEHGFVAPLFLDKYQAGLALGFAGPVKPHHEAKFEGHVHPGKFLDALSNQGEIVNTAVGPPDQFAELQDPFRFAACQRRLRGITQCMDRKNLSLQQRLIAFAKWAIDEDNTTRHGVMNRHAMPCPAAFTRGLKQASTAWSILAASSGSSTGHTWISGQSTQGNGGSSSFRRLSEGWPHDTGRRGHSQRDARRWRHLTLGTARIDLLAFVQR